MQKGAGPNFSIFVISDQGAIHPYGPYPGRRTFVQMQFFARVLERLRLKVFDTDTDDTAVSVSVS